MQKNTKIHKYTKIQKLHKYKNTIIQEYNNIKFQRMQNTK